MEWHIICDEKDISRYIFAPGSHARAKRIADQFEDSYLVTESRGYKVYSGKYKNVFMTVCGTGMGGPTVAIALEELAHMGADTFIRVGSCGVFQPGQKSGDIIIATGTVRAGGTSMSYLPAIFPAVPTFSVLRTLVETSEEMGLPVTVGVGIAGDAFYAPREEGGRNYLVDAGVVSVEMESDTLFIVGQYRGWRTGAIYASDGEPGKIKPKEGHKAYLEGELNSIKISLEAMWKIAQEDSRK